MFCRHSTGHQTPKERNARRLYLSYKVITMKVYVVLETTCLPISAHVFKSRSKAVDVSRELKKKRNALSSDKVKKENVRWIGIIPTELS